MIEYFQGAYLITGTVFYVVFTAWGLWSLLPLRQRAQQDVFGADEGMPVVIIDRGSMSHRHPQDMN